MSVKEAAERLRRRNAGGFVCDIYGDCKFPTEQYMHDLHETSKAYLALVPADDGEAIDEAFVRATLPVTMKFTNNDLESYLIDGRFDIECYFGRRWVACLGQCVAVEVKSRGDVRRLASALGITLKETK